jgi:hypothetical protein
MARAGVGKTAFLVQIGIDHATRGQAVLHIALGQDLEHVHSWYDALIDDLAELVRLENREEVRAQVNKNRLIQAYGDATLPHARFDELLRLFADKLNFEPQAILIDGFDWESDEFMGLTTELGAFKRTAKRLGAELWISAQTHREATPDHPTELIAPCDAYDELIELAMFLEPEGRYVTVHLLKDHDNPQPDDRHLQLHTDTMRLVSDEEDATSIHLPAGSFTLLSGGAKGAEALFGEVAERWGLAEINFSFPGRATARRRGVVELTDEELERGGVSEAYIQAQLHRSFPETERFQRLLKSIWHQVATSGEVFVIGEIQEDDTVKGGTGWAAELARRFRKPLYVFDQTKDRWFQWTGSAWAQVSPPRIRRTRFTGTGTRFLSKSGSKAVEDLFAASFGPAGRST